MPLSDTPCARCGAIGWPAIITIGQDEARRAVTLAWCSMAHFQADGGVLAPAQDPAEPCRCVKWRDGKPCCVYRKKR